MSFNYNKDVSKNRIQSFSSPRDRQIRAASVIHSHELLEMQSEIDRLKSIVDSRQPNIALNDKEERLYTEDEVNTIVSREVELNTIAMDKEIASLNMIIVTLKEQINNLTSILGSVRSQITDIKEVSDHRPSIESVFVDPIDAINEVEKRINIEDINKSNISGSLNKLKSILGDKSK